MQQHLRKQEIPKASFAADELKYHMTVCFVQRTNMVMGITDCIHTIPLVYIVH